MQLLQHAGALILSAATLAAGAAQAAQPGFYIAGAAGQTQQDIERGSGITVILGTPTIPTLPPGGFIGGVIGVSPLRLDSVTVDDNDVSWSGVLGYRINRYVAAEVAYMDFGTADVTERYTITSPFLPPTLTRNYSVSVRGPAVSVLGSLPAGSFDVFLRPGVLFADEKIELNRSIQASMTFGEEVWLAGVGVDWSFAARWAVRAEYQRTGKIDRNITVGENELDQLALSVLFRL